MPFILRWALTDLFRLPLELWSSYLLHSEDIGAVLSLCTERGGLTHASSKEDCVQTRGGAPHQEETSAGAGWAEAMTVGLCSPDKSLMTGLRVGPLVGQMAAMKALTKSVVGFLLRLGHQDTLSQQNCSELSSSMSNPFTRLG